MLKYRWKWLFPPAFGVRSTQTLLEIYNMKLCNTSLVNFNVLTKTNSCSPVFERGFKPVLLLIESNFPSNMKSQRFAKEWKNVNIFTKNKNLFCTKSTEGAQSDFPFLFCWGLQFPFSPSLCFIVTSTTPPCVCVCVCVCACVCVCVCFSKMREGERWEGECVLCCKSL